jgi:hypothetical protein
MACKLILRYNTFIKETKMIRTPVIPVSLINSVISLGKNEAAEPKRFRREEDILELKTGRGGCHGSFTKSCLLLPNPSAPGKL